ncbi:MAG: multidrug efflux pump subunit AcrB [Flavobacterium sp.]
MGFLQLQLTLPSNVSLEETTREVSKVNKLIDSIPGIVESHWFIREGSPRVYYNMLGDQNSGVTGSAILALYWCLLC